MKYIKHFAVNKHQKDAAQALVYLHVSPRKLLQTLLLTLALFFDDCLIGAAEERARHTGPATCVDL